MKTKFVLTLILATTLPLVAIPRQPVVPPRVAEDVEEDDLEGLEALELGDPKKRGVGFLGVAATMLPFARAQQLGINHGVVLSRVVADSPAAKAGLKVNDVITEVEDVKVRTMLDLSQAIKAHREGDRVTFKVNQRGKEVEKRVRLAAAPDPLPGMIPGGLGMQIFPGGGIQLGARGGGIQFGAQGGGLRMGDEEGSVETKGSGEGKEVIVRDLDNEIIFEGPWVTPQDMAAAPPDIRRRIGQVSGIFGGDFPRQNFDFFQPRIAPPPPDNLPGAMVLPAPPKPGLRALEIQPVLPDLIDPEDELPPAIDDK